MLNLILATCRVLFHRRVAHIDLCKKHLNTWVPFFLLERTMLLADFSKYRINMDRAKGVAIGDHSTVHGSFF